MGLQRSSPLSLPISIGAQSIPPRLVSPQQRSTGLVDAGLAGHSFDAVISEPALRAFALQESRNFRLLADTEHSHLPQFRRSRIGVAQTRHAAGFQSTQDAGFAGTECCPLSLLRGRWLQICSRLPAKKKSSRPRSAGAISYVWACTPSAGHWIRILRGLSQGCAFACAPLHQQQRHGAESPRAVREPSRYFDSRRLTRQCWRADQSRFKNGLRRRALAIISAFSPSFRASA